MKRLLFIFALLLAPQVSFGATVLNFGYVGENITLTTGAGNRAFIIADNAWNFPLTNHFVSIPSAIDRIRFQPQTVGVCPLFTDFYVGGPEGNSYLVTSAGIRYIASGGVSGNFCDYTFNASVPDGNIANFSRLSSTIAFTGNTINAGYIYDSNTTLLGTGNFAFQLCNGACGADFPTATGPADGITATTEPTPSSVYLNNPVPFNGTYNNGVSNFYNLVQVQATSTALTNPVIFQYFVATSTGTGLTYSFDHSLPVEGMYGYEIRLMDTLNNLQTPWVYGGSFGLATTTTATTDDYITPAQTTCDTFDFFCYLKKAFKWAMYPSNGLINQYTGLLSLLQEKPPIGYFTIAKNAILGLNASSTPEVSITIPTAIKDNIFHPLDVGIASIFWFFVLFNFYKRLTTITI